MTGPVRPASWPTEQQEWLLRAALGDGDDALASWRRWAGSVALDDVDGASYRMLPLLHRNLVRLGVAHPDLGRMRGIHRHAWVQNQLKVARVAKALATLRAADLPDVMVLKGLPLALTVYGDPGLRPMADVDILLRPADVPRALDALAAGGWSRPPDGFMAHETAVAVTHTDGTEMDVHWQAIYRFDPEAEDAFWADAEPISIGGERALAPSPPDLALHVLAHGARANVLPPFRWAADVVLLLRQRPFDADQWDRFTRRARTLALTVPLLETLRFLRERLAAPVPDEVVATLAATPVSRLARLEHWIWCRPAASRPGGDLVLVLLDYRRQVGRRLRVGDAGPLLAKLGAIWQVPSPRRLPVVLAGKVLARLLGLPRALRPGRR